MSRTPTCSHDKGDHYEKIEKGFHPLITSVGSFKECPFCDDPTPAAQDEKQCEHDNGEFFGTPLNRNMFLKSDYLKCPICNPTDKAATRCKHDVMIPDCFKCYDKEGNPKPAPSSVESEKDDIAERIAKLSAYYDTNNKEWFGYDTALGNLTEKIKHILNES